MTKSATPKRARTTSADVARAAGVSRSTVSFVLNDTPGQSIPESTRQRVLDAAESLRYQPSAAARVLRSGRSDIILFLMPNWSVGELVSRTFDALSRELGERGMTFLVHPQAESNRHLNELWSAITPALVLTDDVLEARELATLEAAGIAHLSLGPETAVTNLSQRDIGALQVRHLHELGHSRLGYAATPDVSLAPFLAPRLAGVRAACEELASEEPVVIGVGGVLDAQSAAQSWIAVGVTAVAAYNDEVALALIAGAREVGITVPTELSIVGADDISTAALVTPSLTTVRLDPAAFIPRLVDMIMERVGRGEGTARVADGGVQIIARESTVQLPARDA